MKVRRISALSCVALVCYSGCGYDVNVAKYEQHGPTTTVNRDGSTTTNTGGESFKLVEVKKVQD